MKKLSALIIVLCMLVCAFASCGGDKVEENPLDKAKEYLQAMYKDDDGSQTAKDYQVVKFVSIEGVKYDIDWTVDKDDVKLAATADGKYMGIDVNEESPEAVEYTLTATIKDAEGKSVSCAFKHTVPQFKVFTIPEVIASNDGDAIVVKGTVTAIDTAWSDEYKNISVYISDDEGNKILCYRLGTNVVVGDVITVKGAVGSYNGAKQIAQGATAVITDHVEIKIDFPEMSLADAIAAEDGTSCLISGTVIKIAEKDAWSDKYNNMSVTITDGKNELYIYRLGTKVELNDVITVKGAVGSYKDAKQIAQGATAEITGKHELVSIKDAIASDDGKLVIVKGTVSDIAEKDAWSDKYGNISVTISDAEGNTLYVYRMNTKVEKGDVITVYGKVGSYKDAKQIAAGCFAIIGE